MDLTYLYDPWIERCIDNSRHSLVSTIFLDSVDSRENKSELQFLVISIQRLYMTICMLKIYIYIFICSIDEPVAKLKWHAFIVAAARLRNWGAMLQKWKEKKEKGDHVASERWKLDWAIRKNCKSFQEAYNWQTIEYQEAFLTWTWAIDNINSHLINKTGRLKYQSQEGKKEMEKKEDP